MNSVDLAQEAHLVAWREAQALDLPFIFSSWLKSFRDAPAVARVPAGIYFASQHALISRLLRRGRVLIACDAERRPDIWGYVVSEPGAAHFTYVKNAFRRLGIATKLCHHAGLLGEPHTHDTILGRHLAARLRSHFNPFLAR